MASNCALILAAGRGERLRPLTDTTPKPLLKVGTSRLIEYQINNLGNAGFTQIYINRAHLRECFDSLLDRQSFGIITLTYLDEPDGALETAGAIMNAFRFIDCDRLLVVNGDIWCDYDFRALNGLPASGDNAHIVLTKNPAHHPSGDFCIDKGRVSARMVRLRILSPASACTGAGCLPDTVTATRSWRRSCTVKLRKTGFLDQFMRASGWTSERPGVWNCCVQGCAQPRNNRINR